MIDLDKLAEEWPSPFVARSKIHEFTKGYYKKSSMSVYDSAGCGVKRRFVIRKTVFYLKSELIEWIKSRIRNKRR